MSILSEWESFNACLHCSPSHELPNYDAFLAIVCCFLVVTSIFEYARKRLSESLKRYMAKLMETLDARSNTSGSIDLIEYLTLQSQGRSCDVDKEMDYVFHSYMVHSLIVYFVATVVIFMGASPYLGIVNIASIYPIILVAYRLRGIHKKEKNEMQRNCDEWTGHKKLVALEMQKDVENAMGSNAP